MENCSYKSYTKSHQPNRVERLLSNINSSILLKMYENFLLQITDFTETQQIYNKYQSGYHVITQMQPVSRNYMTISN